MAVAREHRTCLTFDDDVRVSADPGSQLKQIDKLVAGAQSGSRFVFFCE